MTSLDIAVLGQAALGERHRFLSYGLPERGKYEGWRAIGTIVGSVATPAGVRAEAEPIQHGSFCQVTSSRLPLLSMIDVPSERFAELHIDRLSARDDGGAAARLSGDRV